MNIYLKKSGETNIVEIEGRLDTTNYGELEEKLEGLVEKNESQILMDLSKMDYISSSGLRILLIYLKKIKAMQGKFMLCCLTPGIMEIFEISGFVNIFEIYSDPNSALNQ